MLFPQKLPDKNPVDHLIKAEANILTAPGTAAIKNSFRGGVLENKVCEFIYYVLSIGSFYHSF